MTSIQIISENTRLIASPENWIEGNALEQLKSTSSLKGVKLAAGMPDLHMGKGHPVGAVFVTENLIYPYIIGNDIGCGIGLWQTDLKKNKIKRDKWVKKLSSLEKINQGVSEELYKEFSLEKTDYDYSLGTIGKGNHFAELSLIESIEDEKESELLGLNKKNLMILVHCGSRGLGEYILRSYVDKYKDAGIDPESSEGRDYLDSHDNALNYARLNRSIIASNFASLIGGSALPVTDSVHNSISCKNHGGKNLYFHRKGAVSSLNGAVVVAGTRGSLSYIVKPIGKDFETGHSISHGAGRKWKRGEAKGKLEGYLKAKEMTHTQLGSRVICDDREVLFQEAPQAYKNIEKIIKDMKNAGIIKVVATLSPVITYKTFGRKYA